MAVLLQGIAARSKPVHEPRRYRQCVEDAVHRSMRRLSQLNGEHRSEQPVRRTFVPRVVVVALPAASCTIASARVRTPSLSKMVETWLRTVFSLLPEPVARSRGCRAPLRPGGSTSRSCRRQRDLLGNVVDLRRAGGRRKRAHFGQEHGPGRLDLEQHMVVAIERDEAGARDQGGQVTPFIERHGDVAASVQNQRRHATGCRARSDTSTR